MANYYDYGALGDTSAPLVQIKNTRHSQVYAATHKEEEYLPFMHRSFISFSYGGKNIEDFDLIATIENNSLQRNAYAEFDDNVTRLDVYNGQLFWNSYFGPNILDITLATDGITEKKLDEFKRYFRPGVIKELILSEHPNRAIKARVSAVPKLDLLPFEEKEKIKVTSKNYETSTTLYKGQIKLSFVMDDPFWYSRINVLTKKELNGNIEYGFWPTENNKENIIFNEKDALKILAEDNVVTTEMLFDDSITNNYNSSIVEILSGDSQNVLHVNGSLGSLMGQARVGQGHIAWYIGPAASEISAVSTIYFDGRDDVVKTPVYFYYGGTAPCAPILKFSFYPEINNDGYIYSPKNSFTANINTVKYNTIVFQGTNKKKYFKFTTPAVYTGYNQTINIFQKFNGENREYIRELLRDNVKHYAPRAFANQILDNLQYSTSQQLITEMKKFIPASQELARGYYVFNCQTGQATAKIPYREYKNKETDTIFYLEENVGDMIKSDYLIIEDRNYPSEDGYILNWTTLHPEYSHRIYSDIKLSDLDMQYKYMYL